MTKKEIKKAKDCELVADLANTYAHLLLNLNSVDRGTKQLERHLKDLEDEMLSRGLLEQRLP